MDRGSTPSRKEKDGPTRTSADISVPRLRPAFPEHLITRPHLPCYFTFCFTLVPSVFYTPVTRRTALYYIPTAGRRAEPPPWPTPSGLFTLTARRRRPSSARRAGNRLSCQRQAHACYSEARSSGRYTLTRRPGSHCSLATLQRDQRRQLLPDGTPCLLRPKGSVLHQVFFR